jgi:hypothetical protein
MRATRAQQRVFDGRGMRMEWILNLRGLFPSIPHPPIGTLLTALSDFLLPHAFPLNLLALGFLWRPWLLRLPTVDLFTFSHLQMRIPHQLI